jgi:hypothetical protein
MNDDEVNVLSYGPEDNEFHHDAMYGPAGNALQPYQIAISPGLAQKRGIKLGDWVNVAGKDRQVADWSYLHPGDPTTNTIEIRDRGHVKESSPLRVLSSDEVAQRGLPALEKGHGMEAPRVPIVSIADSPPAAPPDIPMVPLDSPPESDTQIPDISSTPPEPETDIQAAIDEYPKSASIEPTDAQIEAATENGEPPPEAQQEAQQPQEGQPGSQGQDIQSPPVGTPDRLLHVVGVDRDTGIVHYDDGSSKDYKRGIIYQPDQFGNVHAYSKANPGGYLAKKAPTKTADQPPPEIKEGMSADDAIAQLSPLDRAKLKNLLNGDIPAITKYGRSSPAYDRLADYVNLVNPNFDPQAYNVKMQTKLQYGSQQGNSPGAAISATNQAIKHLGSLYDFSQQLGNSNYPSIQAIENYFSNQGGAPAVNNFRGMREALATELARAVQKGAPDQKQIDEQRAFINESLGDAQRRSALLSVIPKILEGQLETMDAGWKKSVGKEMPLNKLIDEKSQDALRKLGITNFAGRDLGPGATPAPKRALPPPPTSMADVPTVNNQDEFDNVKGHWYRLPGDPIGKARPKY